MPTRVKPKKEREARIPEVEEPPAGLSPLGVRLWEIRQRAIANGLKLSNADEIDREMDEARRRQPEE